ncbi:MAG: DUF2520 domain-containing protein [Chloroflexota bacterium]
MNKKTRIGFVGAGTVGTALARALHRAGYTAVAASSRTRASAERLAARVPGCRALADAQAVADAADMVFITTPDDAIARVAAGVCWRKGQAVAHCSGALSAGVLSGAKSQGAWAGAFHPLQTFAGVADADALRGITFAVEAEPPLLGALTAMARVLGGRCITLEPDDRVLYHMGAALASNYVVTLAALATRLWGVARIPPDEALRALLPLLRGTVRNLEDKGLPHALTGPIARGDMGTLRKHITALESRAPEVMEAYRTLAMETIPIALAKGSISPARAQKMRAMLRQGTAS